MKIPRILEKHISSLLSSVGSAALKRVKEAPVGMPTLVTAFGSVYMDLASGIDPVVERARLIQGTGRPGQNYILNRK